MIQLNFCPFPTIITERLILREMGIDDIDALFKIRINPEVMKYIDKPLAKTKADVEQLYNSMKEVTAQNKDITLTIQNKGDPTMLGYLGFWRIDLHNHRAEVGYSLLEKHFGKGINNEALAACIQYGFTQQQFHSLEAATNPANIISQKLLEKKWFCRRSLF